MGQGVSPNCLLAFLRHADKSYQRQPYPLIMACVRKNVGVDESCPIVRHNKCWRLAAGCTAVARDFQQQQMLSLGIQQIR